MRFEKKYHSTMHHTPEGWGLHQHHSKNVKPAKYNSCSLLTLVFVGQVLTRGSWDFYLSLRNKYSITQWRLFISVCDVPKKFRTAYTKRPIPKYNALFYLCFSRSSPVFVGKKNYYITDLMQFKCQKKKKRTKWKFEVENKNAGLQRQ